MGVGGVQQLGAPSATHGQYRADYHGTGGGLFVIVFKNLLLTIVTLGVYLPWARTERRKYLWQNIELDGHRLRYHGTGKELFIGYLKVTAAYIVFIGIPTLIGQFDPEVGRIVQLVAFVGLLPLIPIAIYGSRRYLLSRTSLRGVRFGLDPGASGYLKKFVIGYFLTMLTLGLYMPVMTNQLYAYMTQKTRLGSASFDYDGPNGRAWVITMKGFILSILTLGLFYPWYAAEIARFRMQHTAVQAARGRLDLSGSDMFWILVASIAGVVLTLGIAFPWVTTYVMRTIASKTSFEGSIDYGSIERAATTGDAAADGFADALDVGLEV